MSKIEWTDETWNPVTGCTKISEGCVHCYAERMSKRLAGRYGYPPAPRGFDVALHPDRLGEPLRWKKPRMVFVVSMGDLFHEDVPDEYIGRVWDVMVRAHWHTFQVLTKRADRMREWVNGWYRRRCSDAIPNIWGLVTCENQMRADERIGDLICTRFAVRGVSVEPMLGAVDLSPWLVKRWIQGYSTPMSRRLGRDSDPVQKPRLDWVICGGESAPGARPMHPDWARSLRDQCQAARVPFFFKQWGAWTYGETRPYRFGPAELGERCLEYNGAWTRVYRVGKRAAGRLLDGREWNEMPGVTR